jgi:tetratricopeptide (TPR) repeat protein
LTTFYQLLETVGSLQGRLATGRPLCLLAHYHRYFRVFDLSQAGPAARYAHQAIAAGDRAADAHMTLGILSEKAGRLDEALASFLAAIGADPHHAEALRWAAFVYSKRGDLVNQYRMITAAFVESGDPYYSQDLYHVLIDKVGDAARAVALLEPVAVRHPRDAHLRQRVGHAWALVGDPVRALEHYRHAVALAPQDAGIQNGMGWVLRRFGRVDEAIAAHRRAISLAPGWYVPHSQLMEIHQLAHRYPEAIASAQTALRLGEPNPYVHALLCNFYHYEVDLDRAEACCRHLLARDPQNVWALTLLPKIQREIALR